MSVENTSESQSTGLTDIEVNSLNLRVEATVASIEQRPQDILSVLSEVTKFQAQIRAVAAEVQSKLQQISAAATQAAAAKAQITDAQAIIATRSDHIEGAQKHTDQVRAQMDRALTAAQANATEVDRIKRRTVSIADNVAKIQAAISKSKVDVDSNTEGTRQLLNTASSTISELESLADKADQTEQKIADYEARLAELEKQCNEQLRTIVGLLPGATSAGLASAFDERRQTFLEPSRRWQRWFVGTVIALILLGVTGLVQLYMGDEVLSYEKVLRVWLGRLPVAAALVWLALYTSREASLAKRLEEDYGYKSAIAASFQGFQLQMREIAETVGAESPLGKLCHDTLIAIASPPGRIYEKHALTVSPSGEIEELAGALVDAMGKVAGK
jgi:peptidoglycan hydrolase CwlO-like protein